MSAAPPDLVPDIERIDCGEYREAWQGYWVDVDLNTFTLDNSEQLDKTTLRDSIRDMQRFITKSNLPGGHQPENMPKLPLGLTRWLHGQIVEAGWGPKAGGTRSSGSGPAA